MGEPNAPLHEVFYSLQGEGLWVGVPQVFVRVAGCDLACWYCDTAAARRAGAEWRMDLLGIAPSARSNPATAREMAELLSEWFALPDHPPVHSLALTGGEPLLYPDFIEGLAAALGEVRVPLYLETGGHHPEELARVLPWVDYVALDYKLPSTLPTPVSPDIFARAIRIASQKPSFVKVVVTDSIRDEELWDACHVIAKAQPRAPVVLQPVTGTSRAGAPPTAAQLEHWVTVAGACGLDIRVIPQCHKLLGLR